MVPGIGITTRRVASLPQTKMHLAVGVLQLCSLLALALAADTPAYSPPATFENTAIVRSVDLGGATTLVTTTYQVRALEDGTQQYFFTLSADDVARMSWIEAKVKGNATPLQLESTHAECVPSIVSPRRIIADDDLW